MKLLYAVRRVIVIHTIPIPCPGTISRVNCCRPASDLTHRRCPRLCSTHNSIPFAPINTANSARSPLFCTRNTHIFHPNAWFIRARRTNTGLVGVALASSAVPTLCTTEGKNTYSQTGQAKADDSRRSSSLSSPFTDCSAITASAY